MTEAPSDHADMLERERRGLFGNAMALCMGQGGVMLFGFGAMAVTTRLLGAEGYGRLTVFFMALGVVTQLVIGWPNLAVVRFGREDLRAAAGIGPTFWARAGLYAACGLFAAFALFALRGAVGRYLGLGRVGVWILLAYALMLSAVQMLTAALQSLGRFRTMAALGAGVKLLNFLFLLGLFLAVGRATAAEALGLHLAALLCALAAAILVIRRLGVGRPRFDPARARAMAAYAWPLVLGGLAGVVVEWIDTIVLKANRPLADVGAYGVAYQAVNALGGARAALVTVLWPFVMSLVVEKRRDTLLWYLDKLLPAGMTLVGIALMLVGVAAEAIPWIFGADFAASVLPCQTLVAAVAFTAVLYAIQSVANAYNRVGAFIAVTVVMAALNLVGDLLLVPVWGPMGAAVSTLAAFALGAFLAVIVANSVREVRGERPGRRFLAPLWAAPAMAPALLGLTAPGVGVRVLAGLAACVAWCGAVRVARAFDRSALDRLEKIALPRAALGALRLAGAVLSPREGAE